MGAAKEVLREVYSDTMLPQETRKILNIQCNFTPKIKQGEEQEAPKLVEGKKIINIRVEISEKELKETVVKRNKIENWFFEMITILTNHYPDIKKKQSKIKSTKLGIKKERFQQTM